MLVLYMGATMVAVFVLTAVLGGDSGAGLSAEFPWQFRLAARLRTPVLMFLVIPLSWLLWVFRTAREQLRSIFRNPGCHGDRVQQVVTQIEAWNKGGRKGKLRTARPNWQAMSVKLASNKGQSCQVDMSHLNHILAVDETNMTITVEPGVTMGQVTHRLVPLGLAMQVQVEMESITVGGVTLGFGMETSSHRYGFFQETVSALELVAADGSVVSATPESDPDLFYAMFWSMGTIGFLTSITVRLTKIKPFVHMHYIVTTSPKDLCEKMHALAVADNTPDFLEATIYTRDKAVIQCGRWADKPKNISQINPINHFWKPFYFRWVETFIQKGGGEEYIPFKHYAHRFTRSIFWELEDMIPFSNHPLYRILWGWLGAPEVSLLKLFQGPVIRKASLYAHVVQESIMPITRLAEGMARFDAWFGVYPLLVFPLRVYDRGEHSGFLTPRKDLLEPGKDWGIWVDLGAYGVPRDIRAGQTWDAKQHIREMEHWTRDMGGWQATYTDIFATRREFRSMFNHTLLDKARARFKAVDAFPEPYTKVQSEPGLIDLSQEEREQAQGRCQ